MFRITVEVIPYGVEEGKQTHCVLDVANDGTGTLETGNYKIEAQGVTPDGGWDAWEGFPMRITGIDRREGLEYTAAKIMEVFLQRREEKDTDE